MLHVITAPRPGDQTASTSSPRCCAGGTVGGSAERLTQIEQRPLDPGDRRRDQRRLPAARRASSSPAACSSARRCRRGRRSGSTRRACCTSTGSSSPARGRAPASAGRCRQSTRLPAAGQVVLFTPAWGAPVPRVTGAAEVTLDSFPAAAAEHGSDRDRDRGRRGRRRDDPADRRRPDGDRLGGGEAAGRGTRRHAADGTADPAAGLGRRRAALGGGPVLVKNGKAVFRSLEDFTNDQVASRAPRAGVGQLADGRIVLVAVDGNQPGYSAGMTSFELAQTLQRLGAVTAAAVESGRRRHRRLRRPAARPAERRRRRAAREGGAARRVLRRLLAAAAAAAERRPGAHGRAARRTSSCDPRR